MQRVPEPESRNPGLHVILPADPDSVRAGLKRMLTMPPLAGLAADHRGTAELVLAEVLNNVAEHAYADGEGAVEVSLQHRADGLECLIVDQGVAMPDDGLPAGNLPDCTDVVLEDLPEGGFGWYLIRTLTRDLNYQRQGTSNRLSFTVPGGD